jgi:hypothetical protein
VRGLIVVAALAALAVGAGTVHAAPRAVPAACGKLLPPAQGAYFGAKPGWHLEQAHYDDIVDTSLVDAFQTAGRRMAFATFSVWWHNGLPFPAAQVHTLWNHGQMPLVRIFSFPTADFYPVAVPSPGPITHTSIVSGAHDAELKAWADAARATNIPIGLDYDPEMNSAHPWGGRYDGGKRTNAYGDPHWPDGPELFRDAFRHIVTIFRQEGATNVTFFFHPNTVYGYFEGSYEEPYEHYRWYYPGDDYVDWIGLSVYGEKVLPDGSHASFEQKLQTFHSPDTPGSYAELTALTSKPLALNELGLYKMTDQQKAAWAQDASAVMQSGRYPRIGLVNWWGDNQGEDYDAWPGTFSAGFKAAFNNPFFDAKLQFGGSCLPTPPVRVTYKRGRLAWSAVANATGYEVFKGRKLVTKTTALALKLKTATYRVRGVNPLGVGPFTVAKR